MSKVCCVCNEVKESKDNVIFNCKGQGCDVSVHQGCYGIVTVPTGLWFCRKCESQERAARVRCELCPRKEGALKRTDSGGWAHVVCALYIPEVVFGNNRIMEPIVTSKLPKERFSKSCYICEDKGNETQSTYGACMSCHKPSCRQAFHVTCAQKERLLCEEEDSRDSRNVIYCGYCNTHHKKMLRQKHKQAQALRKPLFPPPVSGSSLFPTTPTSSSSPISTTPLTSLPDLAPPEGGGGREGDRRLERTRSGSPLKVTTKRERPSLSDLPIKRTLTDSSVNTNKPKRRRRKPSSSNESTTSEAPSNGSEFSLIPSSMAIPSPSLHPHPGSPLSSLPPRGSAAMVKAHHEGVGGRGQKGRGVREGGVVHEEMIGVRMTTTEHAGEVTVSNSERAISSCSSEPSSRMQAPPPRSLQELLERQWEQTAQFILDQAGKQNNAGSMLAHLHTLQSENRQMQSRIMELASQREFYIAINTKLRQTLTEHELGHLPNGVQTVGNGLQQQVGMPGEEPMIALVEPKPHPSRPDHQRVLQHQSSRDVESPPLPPPAQQAQPLMGGVRGVAAQHSDTLSKDDQDLLLQAHFSSTNATASRPPVSSSLGTHFPGNEDTPTLARYHQHHVSHPPPHEGTGEQAPPIPGSNFIPALTRIPTPTTSQNATLLSSSTHHHHHAPILEYPMDTSQQGSPVSHHEITQVTNSVHAPISSLTPLPKDALSNEDYGGGVTPGVFNIAAPYKRDINTSR